MPEPKVRRYEEALWLEEEKDLLMAGWMVGWLVV